jgi:hypothetical protein
MLLTKPAAETTVVSFKVRGHAVYLLYWYISTNTDSVATDIPEVPADAVIPAYSHLSLLALLVRKYKY